MSESFFDKPIEEQTASLTQLAHQFLTKYGIRGAEVECINFEFNASFSVTTDSGQRYALRLNINSTRKEANIVAEVQWVRALSSVAGINVPSPIATLNDQFVVSALHAESNRVIYGVMYTWLEGEEIGDQPTLDQLNLVGRSIALMHQHSTEFKLEGIAQLPTFNDFFWGTEDYLFSEKSTLQPEHREAIQRAHDLIMIHTKQLYAVSPVHIIHADYHGWNLMWHEGQLSIFDFDDCGFGIEAQDLAVALYYLDTPEQDAALLEGYKSVRPLPAYSKVDMQCLLLQRRLLLLNYLFETKNAEHKEMLPAYLAKSMDRVSAFLTDVTQ